MIRLSWKSDPAYRPINPEWQKLLAEKNISAKLYYPYTLYSYMEEKNLEKIPAKLDLAIQYKIKELHDLGFLHGDLHARNIVLRVVDCDSLGISQEVKSKGSVDEVENNDYEVRLIDFETMRRIDEFHEDPEQIKIMYDFLAIPDNAPEIEATVQGLIEFEYINYKLDYS